MLNQRVGVLEMVEMAENYGPQNEGGIYLLANVLNNFYSREELMEMLYNF